jgi:hypothetical protein
MKLRAVTWVGLGAAVGVFTFLYREGYVHDACGWIARQLDPDPNK